MEKRRSAPTGINFKNSFTKEGKQKYVFLVAFENGDKGQYFCDSELQDGFSVGIEIDYTLQKSEKNGFTNYFVFPAKAATKWQPRFKDPANENRRVALHNAVTLAAAG